MLGIEGRGVGEGVGRLRKGGVVATPKGEGLGDGHDIPTNTRGGIGVGAGGDEDGVEGLSSVNGLLHVAIARRVAAAGGVGGGDVQGARVGA